MINIQRIHSYLEWEQECFDEIANILLSRSGKKTIALSGGSTPVPIYQRIGELIQSLPESEKKSIRFFLVDERDVSIASPRSNSAMIMNTIGRNFVVPFDPRELSPEMYFGKMCQELGATDVFDLIVLGCGEDGHTASLFPKTALLIEKSSSFMNNELPSGELRYSMTFSLINSAKKRVVFVNNNPEKKKYFEPDFIKEQSYPIHKVLLSPNTRVILHDAL